MQEPQSGRADTDVASPINESWREAEWECVIQRRQRAFSTEATTDLKQEPENIAGLALSGGGIRSALFNDGFLQVLSHRGLLRYFDFLSTVSGGGYIAGHLASQSGKDPAKCFHDDKKRSELGREQATGKVDAARLAGIGGYVSRPFDFIPAYLWSLFFSFTFYIGLLGIIVTLAALLWRSFDDVTFREVYIQILGMNQFGDELLIAFLPAVFFVSLTAAGELLLTTAASVFEKKQKEIKRWHRRFRATMLLAILFALLTSIAIYLGNGKSSVRGGSDTVYLNNYVQYFAIGAGILQLLLYLGRDRLFRSERSEAKGWQRRLQQSVTTIVVLFLAFSMVHWMGREDISGYTTHRDPHLVVGDVLSWPQLAMLRDESEKFGKEIDDKSLQSDPQSQVGLGELDFQPSRQLEPEGKWHGSLVRSRLNLGGVDAIAPIEQSAPPPPDLLHSARKFPSSESERLHEEDPYIMYRQNWWLPSRAWGVACAYWDCVINDPIRPLPNKELEEVAEQGGIHTQITETVENLLVRRRQREAFLKDFNQRFQSVGFTRFLISRLDLDSATTNPKKTTAPALLDAIVKATGRELSENHQKELVTTLHMLGLAKYTEKLDNPVPNSGTPRDTARHPALTNRLLIEALYPSVVQRYDISSTFVVPPFDQQTRIRWLLGWTMLTCIGLIGGLGPYRVETVFQFYRKQLSLNFLVSSWRPKQRYGEKPLEEIKPYLDGLPYPLILAAALEPTSCNGSYRVAARPFVFSPIASGSFEVGETPIPSGQLSVSGGNALTFADAVTLSGAAVTPLMTHNRWLTLILDFFNTGIGQRVHRHDLTKKRSGKQFKQPLILSALFCGIVFAAGFFILDLRFSLLLVLTTAALFCWCWVMRDGSPGLIRSLFILKETHHETDLNGNQSFYIADGGYVDYLGVSELLRRRCELIVVSDAGANIGGDSLGTLSRMCERAAAEQGIRFLDLDHEAPIDFGRLEIDKQTRLVHQPFVCMRVRYPDSERREGLLVYCQMSITDADPIEIKNIRNLFPSFPDEPTVNQFYNEKQVAAYRALGYHIGSRFCSELHPWFAEWSTQPSTSRRKKPAATTSTDDKSSNGNTIKVAKFRRELAGGLALTASKWSSPSEQPLFNVLNDRLLTSYRLACYEEITYTTDDIFGEAIWTTNNFAFPTFLGEANAFRRGYGKNRSLSDAWLERYELNADVRSAYRTAVINDINSLELNNESLCGVLWQSLCEQSPNVQIPSEIGNPRLAAHLTCVAVACQEVHRGRPHAAFQVGGRAKLMDLCENIAKIIHRTAPTQSKKDRTLDDLFRDMDETIAELIEMERSIFQGGEHVATISFAQCMSNEWGQLARMLFPERIENVKIFTKLSNAFGKHGDLSMFDQRGAKGPQSSDSFDLMAAEVRHQLDVGMKEIRLKAIRHGLAKSWYLGYFGPKDWRDATDFTTQSDEESDSNDKAEQPRHEVKAR